MWDTFLEFIPKWGSYIFVCPYSFVAYVQLRVYLVTSHRQLANSRALSCRVWQPINFQIWVVQPGGERRNISVSGGSTPVQKIWETRFVLVIFNYRSHSSVTDWPRTSALAWFTLVSQPFRRLSASSSFSFSFSFSSLSLSLSSFSPSPEICPPLFLTLTLHCLFSHVSAAANITLHTQLSCYAISLNKRKYIYTKTYGVFIKNK